MTPKYVNMFLKCHLLKCVTSYYVYPRPISLHVATLTPALSKLVMDTSKKEQQRLIVVLLHSLKISEHLFTDFKNKAKLCNFSWQRPLKDSNIYTLTTLIQLRQTQSPLVGQNADTVDSCTLIAK